MPLVLIRLVENEEPGLAVSRTTPGQRRHQLAPSWIEWIVLNTVLDPARPLLARMRHDRFGAGILHSVAAVWLPPDRARRYGADPDRPEAADNPGHEADNDEAQADSRGAAAWRDACAEAAVQTSGGRPSGATASGPTTGAT